MEGLATVFVWAIMALTAAVFRPSPSDVIYEIYYSIAFNGQHFIDTMLYIMAAIPSLIRVCIMFIFFCSYLLRPMKDPVLALWARIVESDKPVFTLVFGGAAAMAKTVEEIAKNVL